MEKLGNYFNSELNEYIGKNLPRIMTSIDLDLLQVKKRRKIIRLAEYKHEREKVGKQQYDALKILADIAKKINDNPQLFDNWKLQVLIIRGNKPYDKIEIEDLITDKSHKITDKKQINEFLCLEQLTKQTKL